MRVLLVDDEIIPAQAMLEGVRWKDCGIDDVAVAYTVREAKTILEQEKIDLALLDIEMPEENGMDLLRWIRSKEKLKNIPCAFLTCHAEFAYAQEALQLHCEDYLLKPIEYSKVEDLVVKMVNSLQVRQRKQQIERYGMQWLDQQIETAKESSQPAVDADEIANKIEATIMAHLSDRISVEHLAFQAHLNPDYLNRLFKRSKGMSINKFIINQRMMLALEMIRGGVPATTAAVEVGYQNYAHFVNMFKKTYGILPSQVDEKKGESENEYQDQ